MNRARVLTVILGAAAIGVMCGAVQVSAADATARAPHASIPWHGPACCFKVEVGGHGEFKQNYGTSPNVNIGTESFSWSWVEIAYLEYSESSSGEPSLDPVESPSGHYAPVFHLAPNEWTSNSDEATQCYEGVSCSPRPCEKTSSSSSYIAYNEPFGTIEKVGSSYYPNLKKVFAGHKYVWQVVGGKGPGLTPCGIESDVAVGLEPPPGANGYPEEADKPFGPFTYYVTLPPRNDLRHAKGARDDFQTSYEKSLSFMASDPDPHMTEEYTHAHVEFQWLSRSDVEREVKHFKMRVERESKHGR